jgi:pantetheine-phosphate adenylyltransferase
MIDRPSRVAKLAETLAATIPFSHLRDPALIENVAARWCERHRVWHGPDHLLAMLGQIALRPAGDERDMLLLAALYHDAIYDPRAPDNEERSAALLLEHARNPQGKIADGAASIITASKWADAQLSPLVEEFFALDAYQLGEECPLHERLAYERAIFREYQWADWLSYRTGRRAFLEKWAERFPRQRRGVAECIELLEGLQPRVAIYPGSFAPFHHGHLSMLRQAESVFDKVIVAVGVNRQKPGALESAEKRAAELQSRLRFHEVALFEGLLTSFVEAYPLPITVVRGVRDGTDLEAELRFVRFLNELRPSTGVVWIGCEAEFQHLSSSAIRELEAIEPGAGQRYIPDIAAIYDLVEPVSKP